MKRILVAYDDPASETLTLGRIVLAAWGIRRLFDARALRLRG